MLSDEAMYERMANGWRAGRPETVCGNGSLMAHTSNIRKWLPQIAARYGFARINDAGAGDLNWVKKINWLVAYRAFDLIPRLNSVEKLDITREKMPAADVVLCRMVLNHLDEPRIMAALKLFKESAPYLIATQFNGEDLPQRSPQFMRLDLSKAPYSLGKPLESVQDGPEQICSLALWRL
jgi:hypothetical protein